MFKKKKTLAKDFERLQTEFSVTLSSVFVVKWGVFTLKNLTTCTTYSACRLHVNPLVHAAVWTVFLQEVDVKFMLQISTLFYLLFEFCCCPQISLLLTAFVFYCEMFYSLKNSDYVHIFCSSAWKSNSEWKARSLYAFNICSTYCVKCWNVSLFNYFCFYCLEWMLFEVFAGMKKRDCVSIYSHDIFFSWESCPVSVKKPVTE